MSLRIGVDLGGTKIEALALDGARAVFRKRVATPRGDYAATIEAVRSLVDEIGEGSVGVGIRQPAVHTVAHGNASVGASDGRELRGIDRAHNHMAGTPERSSSARSVSAARSSGRTALRAPPCLPIGVRTASTIQTSVISAMIFLAAV